MKTVAFFNNKGGVGKTSLVYHLAWMFEHLGVRAIAVDLDPQSNLTSVFSMKTGSKTCGLKATIPSAFWGRFAHWYGGSVMYQRHMSSTLPSS